MVKLLVFLSTIIFTTARFSFGRCQTYDVQENFDINQYKGLWYQQIRNIGAPFETGDCVTQDLTYQDGDQYVKVVNVQVVDGVAKQVEGTVYCEGNTARCYVSFGGPYGDYEVFKTDYKTYTQIYSCTNIFFFWKIEQFWVMTRDPNYDSDKIQELANTFLEAVEIPSTEIHRTNQKNCSRN